MTLNTNAGQGQGTPGNAGTNQTNQQAGTPTQPTGPSEEFKGVQRELTKAQNEAKRLAAELAKYEGDLTAEERLAKAQEEIGQLRRDNELNTILRKADPVVHDLIEAYATRTGQVPDEEFVALLTQRVKNETPQPGATQTQGRENSGLRNAPLQAKTKDEEIDDILKGVNLGDLG